jgi:YfiH family protein
MEQVHGGAVARVDRPSPRVPGVDALVTTAHDLALVVLTADCVPILLADPGRGVGAVHAGRRGVEENVVGAAVAALTAATGSGPERVHAAVGPAIGGCCYELPRECADAVAAAVPMPASTTSWGTPSLELRGAAELQLRAAGVRAITRAGGCTRCDQDRWFSHRATARGAAPGRNASAIVRRSAA